MEICGRAFVKCLVEFTVPTPHWRVSDFVFECKGSTLTAEQGGPATNTLMEKTTYTLQSFRDEGPAQEVSFYKLNEDGSFEHGTTLEEMLRVCIERLKTLNEKFSSRENALAITRMQEALMWLNERTRERRERGVEGKHVA